MFDRCLQSQGRTQAPLIIDQQRHPPKDPVGIHILGQVPQATGLAVPGMPIGSPGMEGGAPEVYETVLFGPQGRRVFARFRGVQEL